MRRRTLVVPLLLALGAAGCATSPTSSLDTFAQRSANNSFELFERQVDPPSTLMLAVAHDRQTEGPSCGAHVLASVIRYWKGDGAVTGAALYHQTPPASASGYSMSELLTLAHHNGLLASAVRLQHADAIRELEAGRPVLVPVRIPSVYLQDWSLPGANETVLGFPSRMVTTRVGRLSEWTGLAMINHYVLIVGYEDETFVVLEPVLGFRTMTFDRLERYRRSFNNAAIVFSADAPPAGQRAAAPSAPAAGQP
ncbi:MAG: hypothetical protein AB7O98_01870 [Hyphomonadaceae bacterium]